MKRSNEDLRIERLKKKVENLHYGFANHEKVRSMILLEIQEQDGFGLKKIGEKGAEND
jgi:predicted nucleotidyltransferase